MTDPETISVYQAKAADYEAMPMTDAQERSLSAFLARLPAGALVLDLGCGPGLHARAMMDAGFRVDAIDATPAFVAAARARGVRAREGRFEDVTEQAAYDAVWASFSLLHAPRTTFPAHLAALKRALKPRGLLYLGMKLGEGDHRDSLGRQYSYYTEDALLALLDAAGFIPLDTVTDVGKGLAGAEDPYILVTAHA